LRVNAKLDTVLEKIRMVLRVRAEERKREPRTIIRYALMRSNVEELPDAIARWGDMGIDRMDCGYLAVCNGIDPQESLYFHQDLMSRVFAEARRAAARYPRLRLNLPPTVRDEQPKRANPARCRAPWRFVKIDTDGRILPCYRAWEAINMGKVYDGDGQDFRDIWNSDKYQALRRTVIDDTVKKSFPFCARCDYRYGCGDLALRRASQPAVVVGAAVVGSEADGLVQVRDRAVEVAAREPQRAPVQVRRLVARVRLDVGRVVRQRGLVLPARLEHVAAVVV